LRQLGIRRIGLFGSFRRDASDSESDIDLLIEFAPDEKSFDNFMAVSFLLEEELGRSVELVTSETKRAIWKRPARRSAGKSSPRTRR
jgi:predicted nucleotidyltransferase